MRTFAYDYKNEIKKEIDESLVIGDRRRSLRQGACTVNGWNLDVGGFTKTYFNANVNGYLLKTTGD